MELLEDEEKKRRTDDRWHVGKEIPLALVVMIIMQTGAWIWWAATLNTKMDDLAYQVAAINADRYTKTDAQKDGALYTMQISDLSRRVENVEKRK